MQGHKRFLKKLGKDYIKMRMYPVQIILEPENPVDKAFKCRIDRKWFRFGYAVTEVTDQLHSTMHNNLVTGVTFKDIRFVGMWSKCTPGFMQQ